MNNHLKKTITKKVPPVVSFVGYSGAGKTTLMEALISMLSSQGLKIVAVKHDVHGFEMDKPGKDSWRHKQAGAVGSIISSANQIGLVMDVDHDHAPFEIADMFCFADIIFAEGYKYGDQPKIEIFRPEATHLDIPLCIHDPNLIALVSDEPQNFPVRVFKTKQYSDIAQFIVRHFALFT